MPPCPQLVRATGSEWTRSDTALASTVDTAAAATIRACHERAILRGCATLAAFDSILAGFSLVLAASGGFVAFDEDDLEDDLVVDDVVRDGERRKGLIA